MVLPTVEIAESLTHPFVDFIDAVLPYVRGEQPAKASDLWKNVVTAANKLLPFRERAPGRAHLRVNPVFTSARPDTATSVVRSLIIHRGITFNSPKELDHPGLFTRRQDWYSFRGDGGDTDEALFCDRRAYGQPNDRSSKHFETYWRAGDIISRYLNAPTPPSFVETLSFVRTNGPLEGFALPSFGPLSTLLLVEDMVYAGLVSWPSVEEFGAVVAELGKGATDALVMLGLISHEASQAEIAGAFVQTYRYANNLPDNFNVLEMGFDMFMLEHALCKYKRCYAWL
ncbi:hypothetical protein CYLTODRAFT_353996 [Cylindrobasidium torrendii FP15055 ss-10]|uniref:Uncharacterized protein n=1 Tax=Cylindrobasidium torrendii FP15055 ss-10 TaxID=1314674 RepID=A0A0D7BA53_9AGAR|nr:hypothetical protein CYLTODRAFT_353996 [Cylindrobasidium torrendii FP15055 ss-10]